MTAVMLQQPKKRNRRRLGTVRRLRIKDALLCGRPWVECHYCGCRLTFKTATLDHVVALAHGGELGMRNIVLACKTCNEAKRCETYPSFVKRIAA